MYNVYIGGGKSMTFKVEKIKQATAALNKFNVDMWIIAGQESSINTEPMLDVFTDNDFIGMTAVIFTKEKAYAISTPLDANGYRHEGVFDEVFVFDSTFEETLAEVVKKLNPNKIALNYSRENPASDGLTVGIYNRLKKGFELADYRGEVISAQKICEMVRSMKTEEEVAAIKYACEQTQVIFDEAKDFIKAGVNLREIVQFFQNQTESKGYGYSWPKSCNPGVFSGPDCPSGHMGAVDLLVEKGHLVNIDFGITINGYSSDMQRMYYILKDDETDAPEDVKAAFYAIRDGIKKAADYLKTGVLGIDVDSVAREYITGLGYPSWGSALGHQLGRVAHDGGCLLAPEKPRYNRDDLIRSPILKNSVFTLEPNVKTRCGGIGLEEDVVVKDDKAYFLVEPQQELYLIK